MSFSDALRVLSQDGAAIWGFLMAAALVLVLTPLVARLAPHIGGIDEAKDRPRVHKQPIPRIGGLAIVAGILVPAAVFVGLEAQYLGILLGTLGVAALGLYDDLHGLRPSRKLAGVALLALIPVAGYDVTLGNVTLPLIGDHQLGWLAYPLAVLWIAGVANLVNLIDGMDSLAAGIVAIAAAAFAILAASFLRADAAALAAIVCGATLGFLRHNYHPAKIFMGDTGALALGFLLATLALDGLFKTAAAITLVAPMLVLAVPILDTSFVVLKRLKYRRPPFGADHNHFYHRFLRIGFSQRRTAAYLHLWAATLAGYAVLVRFVPPRPGGVWDTGNTLICAAFGLATVAASVWMVYTLEILKFRHLDALRLRRLRPAATDAEIDDAVHEDLATGEFEAVREETGEMDVLRAS
jgi:UDP-GlcNAc:undecaprenyl-phosphate GlcNAc-1-phosphate transferase